MLICARVSPAAVENFTIVFSIWFVLRFKHFARVKKFDVLQNVYIPAECHSWRQLSINPYTLAGNLRTFRLMVRLFLI